MLDSYLAEIYVSRMDPQKMVGLTGFEPATPCTPYKYATILRYSPTGMRVK